MVIFGVLEGRKTEGTLGLGVKNSKNKSMENAIMCREFSVILSRGWIGGNCSGFRGYKCHKPDIFKFLTLVGHMNWEEAD